MFVNIRTSNNRQKEKGYEMTKITVNKEPTVPLAYSSCYEAPEVVYYARDRGITIFCPHRRILLPETLSTLAHETDRARCFGFC